MEKEEQLFRKRIQELAENAYSRDIPLHTDFLTLAEQTVFQNMSATLPPVKFVLSGGFPMSERKVLCFLASYGGGTLRAALRVFKDRSRKQALRGEADPQRLSRGDHESRNREGHDRGHRPAGWKCLGVCHRKDEQISCGESHDDPAHLCCHGDHGRFF